MDIQISKIPYKDKVEERNVASIGRHDFIIHYAYTVTIIIIRIDTLATPFLPTLEHCLSNQ